MSIDPETMSMEELMKLANAEMAGEPVVEPAAEVETPEQPRNADGTFATKTPTEPVVEAVVPTNFSRTIDLGDGSGAQVFSADTLEGLVDKLAEAQKHATRKIRELNQVAKNVPKSPARKELTPDEEYLLGQRLISEPSKAVKELLEAEYGMTFAEIKEAAASARQITQERIAEANAVQWVQNTPDYHPIEANGRKIKAYINKMFGGEQSVDNLQAAYQDLKDSGLLQEKPAEVVEAPKPVAKAAPRASSLSSRISTVEAPPSEPSIEDMYKMPMEELANRARGIR